MSAASAGRDLGDDGAELSGERAGIERGEVGGCGVAGVRGGGFCSEVRSGGRGFAGGNDHGGADGGVADRVDEDERAHLAAFGVGVEEEREAGIELDFGDVVHVELLRREMRSGGHVNAVADAAHGGADGARGVLGEIRAAGDERLLVHPDDHGAEGAAGLGFGFSFGYKHFASAEVDFVFELDGDAAREGCGFEIAVEGDESFDARGAAAGQSADTLAGADFSALNAAGEAAEGGVGANDELHGKTQRAVCGFGDGEWNGFEIVQQRGAGVPRHVDAGLNDVVAGESADGDELDAGEIELRGECGELTLDVVEDVFTVVDKVHLVNGRDDVRDAQQACDVRVAARLRKQRAQFDEGFGVDEDDGDVGGRSAGGHVAGCTARGRGCRR